MKKENLIAQLEGAKALSSQVDIDKVIELLNQLEPEIEILKVFGITQDVADNIADKIERSLDYNSEEFVDTDSAEFELDWNNVIRLNRVDVYVDNIMAHVTATIDSFVLEEDEEGVLLDDLKFDHLKEDAEETEDDIVTLERIDQGLGLEPGGNPYAE